MGTDRSVKLFYYLVVRIGSLASLLAPYEDVCRGLLRQACPLFVLVGPGQPRLIGSGVPLQIGSVSVIATAAHVLRPYGQASVFTLGRHQELLLTGERRGFGWVKGRDADVDLAVVVLDEVERAKLHEHYVFTYSMHFALPRMANDAFYGVIGYPQSKNKLSPRLQTSNRATGMYYISRNLIDISEIRSEGKFGNVHFALGAEPKNAIGDSGGKVNFPSPLGMSGGGVWRFDPAATAQRAPEAKLVGIMIEHCKRPGAFVCTRVNEVAILVEDLQRSSV